MKKLLLFLSLSTLGLGLAGCGEDEVPARPSYALHVQPLLVARCVRCHGSAVAGVTDPDPDSPPLPDKTKEKPTTTGFETFETARPLAVIIASQVSLMPPPPSPPLTDREKEILVLWSKNPLP
jgi:hypothetical protein